MPKLTEHNLRTTFYNLGSSPETSGGLTYLALKFYLGERGITRRDESMVPGEPKGTRHPWGTFLAKAVHRYSKAETHWDLGNDLGMTEPRDVWVQRSK